MRAVVSGATSGLGGALATELASLGVQVTGCGSRAAGHPYERVDVTDRGAVEDWAARSAARGEPFGWIVANAAVALPTGPAALITSEQFRRLLDVNVFGVFTLFTEFAPYAATDCVFVAVSSQWGLSAPRGGQLAYCASKFAVEGLTAAWRHEIGVGQKVYAFDPGGGVNTPMTQGMTPPSVLLRPPVPLADWAVRAGRFVHGLRNQPQGPTHVRLSE